jgi:uncharacterized protein (DUF924 family)|tara:strand:+ start:568 stop:1107 length:540 start_codon:yes stop_codon:yes gene_type:complete
LSTEKVLEFWFAAETRKKWWVKEPQFDQQVAETLGDLHRQASDWSLDAWRDDAEGCLALVLLLDQVPRNIYRQDPRSFAFDAAALDVTRHALEVGFDTLLTKQQRLFLYLPLEHSEALEDQERSVTLMTTLGDPETARHAIAHRDIIARFGRFPHRNAVIGRQSTAEEEAFLQQPGSSF